VGNSSITISVARRDASQDAAADLTLRCALKLTHDATVAIAEDAALLASIEMEKVANRPRY
jgi:hypothetical protein